MVRALLFLPVVALAGSPSVRLGVLAYGTLRWESTTIQAEGLDRKHGFELETRLLASPQAGRIAFLGREVDLFVSDWIWAASQRLQGRKIQAAPYHLNHGALLVREGISELSELEGKRLGVAGGALDKNWLLLQALYRKRFGKPLTAEVVFGAPPLLSQLFRSGRLDALLTYWHHAAELEAQGYRKLLTGRELLLGLGIRGELPALGYLFWEEWASDHPELVRGFLEAAYEAKQKLCREEKSWARIRPLLGTEDPEVEAALRKGYCEGIPSRWGEEELQAARALYRLLYQLEPKVAQSPSLPEGTFYPDVPLPR